MRARTFMRVDCERFQNELEQGKKKHIANLLLRDH